MAGWGQPLRNGAPQVLEDYVLQPRGALITAAGSWKDDMTPREGSEINHISMRRAVQGTFRKRGVDQVH